MNEENFYKVYERNVDTVYQIAFMHLRNKSDAEDAVQNIFLKYISTKPEIKNESHEKAWFVLTARNHCRDILRTWWMKRRTESETEQMYEPFDMDHDGEITEVLMNLPVKYRDVLYLYYYQEYSIKEIALILKMKENTVRTQLCRARDRMKNFLEKEEFDYGKERTFEGV